jgi:4-amino-4-deoxy-L-arabinose transferase-like glycosyltransferase
MKHKPASFWLFSLIAVSTFIRGYTASVLELGIDEVYYVNYARFFSLSYFDHPPLVGWVIRFFTLDLLMTSELYIRLGAVFCGSIGIFLMYRIGESIRDERAGLIAAFIYASSLYPGVISGLFILPDTPQSVFWLGAMWLFLEAFQGSPKNHGRHIIWAGVLTGLAIYSKYHAVFLWVGAGGYILFYKKEWLKTSSLYISIGLSMIPVALIFIWNATNDFISFTFHEDRVSFFTALNPESFFQELLGEFFYQNPILFILYLWTFFQLKPLLQSSSEKSKVVFLLWFFIPLWVTVVFIALFRSTLPHWSGPAFFSMMLLSAMVLSDRSKRTIPRIIYIAAGFYFIIIVTGVAVINTGWVVDSNKIGNLKVETPDVTTEVYGWKQGKNKFEELIASRPDLKTHWMMADRWYVGSHVDFYIAQPLGLTLNMHGSMQDLHQYYWINQQVGRIKAGENAWYVVNHRYYRDPNSTLQKHFERIEPIDTLKIIRNERQVEALYVYYLHGFKE